MAFAPEHRVGGEDGTGKSFFGKAMASDKVISEDKKIVIDGNSMSTSEDGDTWLAATRSVYPSEDGESWLVATRSMSTSRDGETQLTAMQMYVGMTQVTAAQWHWLDRNGSVASNEERALQTSGR
ncbi:hypothetical protein BDP27DRAFT_1371604 [Rhodocollybia butyracea]|uniref:Uncharacterized protein n=1 Tax=Rhodocollybia butyracea TaxID=206335 RepID=A0A9P5P5P0_9AGAR|nr:hypothetical protein BDP27DRAFT_1371604 [Rhodocollybia butyracea]